MSTQVWIVLGLIGIGTLVLICALWDAPQRKRRRAQEREEKSREFLKRWNESHDMAINSVFDSPGLCSTSPRRDSHLVVAAGRGNPAPRISASAAANPAPTDDGFVTSMLMAEMSDSTLLGYAAGGNIAGALVGESMTHSLHSSESPPSYDPSPSSSCDTSSAPSYDSGSSYSSSDSSYSSSCDSGSSFSSGDSTW